MARQQSIPSATSGKPYRDFPLTPRGDGRFCKRINGRLHYFRGDWKEALVEYNRVKDDLYAGRSPSPISDQATVKEAVNSFLRHKQQLAGSGEITQRTFNDYHKTCGRIVRVLGRTATVAGLRPDDFARLRADMSKTMGPVSLGNDINRVRCVFKFTFDERLVNLPVHYGQSFKRPSRKTLRLERARNGVRMLEADQIRALLGLAPPQLKAMILLGVNCGFGNEDVGRLPRAAIDFETGWLDYPRPKTGIRRRCLLWRETLDSIQASMLGDHDLVFVTRYGNSWSGGVNHSPVSREFRKLLDTASMHRAGLGFYALRRVFETVAGDSGDQVAVNHIMGHVDASMAAVYRERINDERLERVANHVYLWLFHSGRKPR